MFMKDPVSISFNCFSAKRYACQSEITKRKSKQEAKNSIIKTQQECYEFPLRITAYIIREDEKNNNKDFLDILISENNPDTGEPFSYEMYPKHLDQGLEERLPT
ncbi:hypothetical protein Glove_300g61 [Diversispora epigaea]|uniref:Uncharacterized protein n=1 Tax=Diversispora epigaea TaxID=1348612 RepID=A0A397HXW7_9GLOM|nr:hypothetical protein Glove_300g61 [Diversispora epigaea]